MRRISPLLHLVFAVAIGIATYGICGATSLAQENGSADKQTGMEESTASQTDPKLIAKFKKRLTNTKLVGQFTVSGAKDQKVREEEYTITRVEKLKKGDWWEIESRIKYGKHDVTVPMKMEVKWAGETPVITVNRLLVPGLGTFDARVLLRQGKYSGTWAHDEVGGHLFGKIVKLTDAEDKAISGGDSGHPTP